MGLNTWALPEDADGSEASSSVYPAGASTPWSQKRALECHNCTEHSAIFLMIIRCRHAQGVSDARGAWASAYKQYM